MKLNEKNKQIWDAEMGKLPPAPDENTPMCEDENGNLTYATPLGYDDDMKEYSAVKDIIEGAIKSKNYKCWKIKSKLVETYTDEHEEIVPFDVVFLFSSDWEIPIFPVLITDIDTNKKELSVSWIKTGPNDEDDDVAHKVIQYTE